MYLGELVRIILVHLVKKQLLFHGDMPEVLTKPGGFLTKMITETERDPSHLFHSTHAVLTEDLHIPIVDHIDDRVVRRVCETVATRAAFLAGAGIAACMYRLNRRKVTIGIDGSLYKFHPRFRERMTDIIDQLKPPAVHVSYLPSLKLAKIEQNKIKIPRASFGLPFTRQSRKQHSNWLAENWEEQYDLCVRGGRPCLRPFALLKQQNSGYILTDLFISNLQFRLRHSEDGSGKGAAAIAAAAVRPTAF